MLPTPLRYEADLRLWPDVREKMAHYCRICDRDRPNEKFSGRGHKIHVCKECAKMRKTEREAVEHEDEVLGFMHQSHISSKNLDRLQALRMNGNPRISELAGVVTEVAAVTPFKKRRLQILAQKHPDLMDKLEETGLIFAHHVD